MPTALSVFASLPALKEANRARARFDDPGHKLSTAEVFPPEAIRPEPSAATSLLLRVHTDTGAAHGTAAGPASAGGRSDGDVLALVHVPADGTDALILVLNPRTAVERGVSLGALTDDSGWPMSVAVVEECLGQRVDHVLSLDVDALAGIVDQIGPLPVYSSTAFTADGIDFGRGTNHLDAAAVRAFVTADPVDDAGQTRTRNQRSLLRALVGGLSLGRLAKRPRELAAIASLLASGSRTDVGLTTTVLAGLSGRLRGISPADIVTVTVPTTSRRDESGRVIVEFVSEAVPALREALAEGRGAEFVRGIASLGY